MSKATKRVRDSCDACALRRVKCDGKSPCFDCEKRSIDCTRRRQRLKRGPKGPRPATAKKIEALLEAQGTTSQSTSPDSNNTSQADHQNSLPESWSYEHSSALYLAHLGICRRELSTLWPIIDTSELAGRLTNDPNDWKAQVLAASLCAATIAQLRLDHRPEPGIDSQPDEFAKESIRLRILNNYQDHPDLDSLLTSFFLHIYYSNYKRLRSAMYLLREMVTTLHILGLHELDSYNDLSPEDYQRRLRIFWIIFVTEKTFCAQNYHVPILNPISVFPSSDLEDPNVASSMAGLCALSRLFILLEASFFQSRPPSQSSLDFQTEKPKIRRIQQYLQQERGFPGISESQHVDLNVTRQWLRAIIWRYFTHHLPAAHLQETGLSMEYPLQVARETLTLLSDSTEASIVSHGYGMELKLSRLAESVLDIMEVSNLLKHPLNTWECREVLHYIGGFLETIGGDNSDFAVNVKTRLQELDLPITIPQELPLPDSGFSSGKIPRISEPLLRITNDNKTRTIEESETLSKRRFGNSGLSSPSNLR